MTREPVKIVLTFFKKHLKSIILFVVAFILGFALGGHFYTRVLGVIANVFRNTSGDIDMNIVWTAIGAATTGFLGWAAVSQNRRLIRLEESKENPYLAIDSNRVEYPYHTKDKFISLNFKNYGSGDAYDFNVDSVSLVDYISGTPEFYDSINVYEQKYVPKSALVTLYFNISNASKTRTLTEEETAYFNNSLSKTGDGTVDDHRNMAKFFTIKFSYQNALACRKHRLVKLMCCDNIISNKLDEEDTTNDNT